MNKIFPVVLSGGSGTRLWPLSRSLFPKQFINFGVSGPRSFLGSALKRLPASEAFEPPIILCNNDHRFLVRAELETEGIEPRAIILEPVARNTAPAIIIAALMARRDDPGAIIVVMPSDHVIPDEAVFRSSVRLAADLACAGRLVLLGIRPEAPYTGYGYIERGEEIGTFASAFKVSRFVEKPDLETAKHLVASGKYFWNSGIFVLHAQKFLDEVALHAPEVLLRAEQALASAKVDLGFLRLERSAFERAPAISVDHAVMERTSSAVVLPLESGWSDVGSWSSLWAISQKDDHSNAANGDVVLEDSEGCYIHATKRLVAAIGIKNLVVVETPDALLVVDKARDQQVGEFVKRLRSSGRREQEQHLQNHRPWGFFETLNIGSRFQVKLLHVKPGARLSLQMHHHRSEHWIVVQGTANVTIGGQERLVQENESVYITATQWHRLENPGKVPLELIEVQIGTYLGEDDIIRTDDDYQRLPDETR